MPEHAFNRSVGTRLLSARGAVAVGTFAALTCVGVMSGTAQAADSSSASTATAKTARSAGTTTYTVKSGDSLIGIAGSQKVSGGWQAIASANKISSPYTIYPGQSLTLPTGSAASSAAIAVTVAQASATTTSAAGSQTYADNLDGWINHSLAIMARNGIPGSYDGIHRNIMRESSGNPNAINLWDSNAAAGHPSIGLLQLIQPTFTAYHVPGTSSDIYDPVANITAACNYAYHTYGSIDNVNGAY